MENSIKVGYDSQTGFYTLKCKNTYNTSMEVNGKSVNDPLRGFRSGELTVISEKPETITYKTSTRKVIGYDNTEDMTTIGLSEYNKILEKVNSTREYDEDTEDYYYAKVEDEVFAIRFFRTHKPIYETIETVYNLEIEIIEYPVSEYKSIVPIYSIDAKNIFETNCKFTPNNIELLFEVCESFGIDKSRIEIPTHSGVRYVKIDDKFVTGMEDFEKTASLSIINTYEKCIERMNSNRKKLEDLISFHIAKQSQKVLDKATVGHLLTELKILQNSVYGLDVKQRDHATHRSVLNRINELTNVYKELA